jgi:phage baseplate assembly protein W
MATYNYLGSGWGFPPQFFNHGKDVRMVSDEADVKEALQILLSTALGERLHHAGFGCDLHRYMFEEVNRALVMEVQETVLNAIYDYEPRVKVTEIEISEAEADADAKSLFINIGYLIIDTHSADNLVYTLSLE